MQEYALHGWNEEKCAKHRQNAKEGNFQTQCDREGTCVYTGAPRIKLTYEEYKMLQEVLDFSNTRQILSDNFDHRQRIIYLAGQLAKMQAESERIKSGKTGRT